MKPQTMTLQTFFLALCSELNLSPTDSDEDTVIAAIKELKWELNAAEMASGINFLEWEKSEQRVKELEALID